MFEKDNAHLKKCKGDVEFFSIAGNIDFVRQSFCVHKVTNMFKGKQKP